jgi:hypothetical protein
LWVSKASFVGWSKKDCFWRVWMQSHQMTH